MTIPRRATEGTTIAMHPASSERRSRRPPPPFVAIDFETATKSPDSACAVALVRVENDEIVHRETRLIRPPRREFIFTDLHGISWDDVATAPTFGELWPKLVPMQWRRRVSRRALGDIR